jgi:hypothetical protein
MAERLALLFKGTTEAAGTLDWFQSTHGVIRLLDSTMILLQPISQRLAAPVLYFPPQRFPDGLWVGGVLVRGDFLWLVTHRLQALCEEGFGRFEITRFAQAYIDRVAELIKSPVQIAPLALYNAVVLIR